MQKFLCYIVVSLCFVSAHGQELYPMTEPASNVPKGSLGIRYFSESYNEIDRVRNLFALRIMYGLTPRLTVEATPTVSNHHNKTLPVEFPTHNTPQIGVHHPYLFNGVDFYAKYRFLSIDGQNSHFRAALYGEYSILKVAHDEAEPTLLDDNSGWGAGIITTYLKNHFAISFTGGIIVPFNYTGDIPDQISSLPDVPATVIYGKAYNYSLSFGYLLFPKTYSTYNQANWNIYLEFIGKDYAAMQLDVSNIYLKGPQYSAPIPEGNKALLANEYVEAYPGIQCIIRSTWRAEFSLGFPVINRSYVHFYPVYNIGVQRYFNFIKQKKLN